MTLWTEKPDGLQPEDRQAPLSMGFSRQEYCSGWPVPYPGDLPNLEIEPGSPALQAGFLPPGKPNEMHEIAL